MCVILFFAMKLTTVKHAFYAPKLIRSLLQKVIISKESHSLINFELKKDTDINQVSVPCICAFILGQPTYFLPTNRR